MIVPQEVCSEAHELQMHTLQLLGCTDTNYETMKDKEKHMKKETDIQTQSERKKVCERETLRLTD